jgi:uncharacterized protein with GYD domain
MATYIVLSRLSPEAFDDPKNFKKLADNVSSKIKKQCPDVTWKHSWATMGSYDVVDVVESDDEEQLQRAILIIRAYGHATTETLSATPWREFLDRL